MKVIVILIFICLRVAYIVAQISVSDCSLYEEHVTQNQVQPDLTYYGGCIVFDSLTDHTFTDNQKREVLAANQIRIEKGFQARGFTGNKSLHLALQPEPNLVVTIMNYESLENISRYKKLELGVALPIDVIKRVNHYLFNEGQYLDELNPFVDWDVDIEAHFVLEDGGWFETVDGFYYREYEVDSLMHNWIDKNTDQQMRIRFSPPKNGKWRCWVTLKIEGVEVYNSAIFKFNVVESGDPGFVHVHSNKKNLMQGYRMIYPVGQNFISPDEHVWLYPDKSPPENGGYMNPFESSKATSPFAWDFYLKKIQSYFDKGGGHIRTMQTAWASLIEFEKRGNYYDRLNYAWEQDKLLDMCEENNALISMNLMYQSVIQLYNESALYAWDWGSYNGQNFIPIDTDALPRYCYNHSVPGNLKYPRDMFTFEEDLKYHEQRHRYYIARYGYSTKVLQFEFVSETFHMEDNNIYGGGGGTGSVSPYSEEGSAVQHECFDALYNYHKRMADYIKDSMNHKHHLLGVNFHLDSWNIQKEVSYQRVDSSFKIPNIDVLNSSWYSDIAKKYISSGQSDVVDNNSFTGDENSMRRKLSDFHVASWKPILITEGDYDEHSAFFCMKDNGSKMDAMQMGFIGAAGFYPWNAGRIFREPNIMVTLASDTVWQHIINAEKHMNSIDVINTLSDYWGTWTQGAQQGKHGYKKELSKETQYYVSHNQEGAAGYVRNLTYNHYTFFQNAGFQLIDDDEKLDNYESAVNIGSGNAPFSDELFVIGLKKNTDYEINWYTDNLSNPVRDCQNTTNKGRFKLNFPVLDSKNPVYWYVIKQKNCDGKKSMNISDTLVQNITYRDKDNYKEDKPYAIPNPFTEQLNISSSIDDQIIITSIQGTLLLEQDVQSGQTLINTYKWTSGVYLVRFKNQNSQLKIIKL